MYKLRDRDKDVPVLYKSERRCRQTAELIKFSSAAVAIPVRPACAGYARTVPELSCQRYEG